MSQLTYLSLWCAPGKRICKTKPYRIGVQKPTPTQQNLQLQLNKSRPKKKKTTTTATVLLGFSLGNNSNSIWKNGVQRNQVIEGVKKAFLLSEQSGYIYKVKRSKP